MKRYNAKSKYEVPGYFKDPTRYTIDLSAYSNRDYFLCYEPKIDGGVWIPSPVSGFEYTDIPYLCFPSGEFINNEGYLEQFYRDVHRKVSL